MEQALSNGEKEVIATNLRNAVDCLYLVLREYKGLTPEQVESTIFFINQTIKQVTALEIELRKELALPIWIQAGDCRQRQWEYPEET